MGRNDRMTVLVTGTTGNLGAYLLHDLLTLPDVAHVFCLNRSSNAADRQRTAHVARGLSTSFDGTVTFLHSPQLAAPYLGLAPETYDKLVLETTHIIHNAWPVDFNRHFDSFEPNIRGVRRLIDLALASPHKARLLFVSSVSAAGNWSALPGARSTVPEAAMEDWKVARLGYGQSKLLAERLIAEASLRRGLNAAVCRVGQLAGPVRADTPPGACWPKSEWVPMMIKSSQFMGIIPQSLGPMDDVDWVPVDISATIISQICLAMSSQREVVTKFYHVVNPRGISWKQLVPDIIAHVPNLVTVPLKDWVDALRETGGEQIADPEVGTAYEGEQHPATKILSFFEVLSDRSIRFPKTKVASFETVETTRVSPALAQLQPVSRRWVDLWMRQWGFT